MVSLQGVIFAKLDFPKIDFNPVRSRTGSHAAAVHLGELQEPQKTGLSQRFCAFRGGLAKPQLHESYMALP